MTKRTGQCLCGGVTLTAHGDVIEADVCHCSMCRRQGGGGAYFAARFTGGITFETSETLKWYRGSTHGERGFCTDCGASIAWRLQAHPDKVGVSLGALNDTSGIQINSHIFTDNGPDYYTIPTDAPHKTGQQVMTEFMERQQQAENK